MKTSDEFWKELKEIAPELAKLNKRDHFKVPENYFVNFTNKISAQVNSIILNEELESDTPQLASLDKSFAAPMPAGYFSAFSSKLIERIREQESREELKFMAPTLNALVKVNNYQAPEGYFGSFATSLNQQIGDEEFNTPAAIMPAWLQRINGALESVTNNIFKPRYAFAFTGAATVMIMAMLIFVKVQQPPPVNPSTNVFAQLQQVSDEDLDAYINNHPDEFNVSVLDMSTNDAKLKAANNNETLSLDQYMLNNISDEDLQNALL